MLMGGQEYYINSPSSSNLQGKGTMFEKNKPMQGLKFKGVTGLLNSWIYHYHHLAFLAPLSWEAFIHCSTPVLRAVPPALYNPQEATALPPHMDFNSPFVSTAIYRCQAAFTGKGQKSLALSYSPHYSLILMLPLQVMVTLPWYL